MGENVVGYGAIKVFHTAERKGPSFGGLKNGTMRIFL